MTYVTVVLSILNFAGLLSIVVEISTHFSMTSHSKNEDVNAATFNMMTGYFVEFEQSFYSKSDHFIVNLSTNTIEHVSEMGLYIILSTLDKFERWNQTLLIMKYQWAKWCHVHGHLE